MGLRFAKGTALGNDYLVIDAADLPCALTPARARLLCDRHRGIGADGILLGSIDKARAARAREGNEAPAISLRIINPDGSEAEKSGNGLRIFGAYLHQRRVVGSDVFDVALQKDTVAMRVESTLPGGALMIRVAMGRATFGGREHIALRDGGTADANIVSMGNPHCVVFVDTLDRTDFLERAPQLCTHARFPAGTNVQFARVIDEHTVEAWIWERGAGETMASGSSACAVCAACVHEGLLEPGVVEVRMAGGNAEVEVAEGYSIALRGSAQMLFDGELTEALQNEFNAA